MDFINKVKTGSEYTLPISQYEVLAEDIVNQDCFRRTYFQYLFIFLLTILGLGSSIFLLTISSDWLLQIFNGVLFGFFSVQLGLIGHDLSHNSVFTDSKINQAWAVVVWGLGCGLSAGRWFYKHNAHHSNPNHIGHDPDLEIPFVFSHEQAEHYSDFYKHWIFPYQHILFWVGLWFVYPYNILNSMRFIFKNISLRTVLEVLLMVTHFCLLFGITFYTLPFFIALTFNLVVFFTMGIYMGLIFAPNHKGEDMLATEATYNWVHQITLTRNITPGLFTSYFLGGLEHQIEHHLFPSMPRFRYQKARSQVKEFCSKQKIPYHETSWLTSLQQIHASLKTEACSWSDKR